MTMNLLPLILDIETRLVFYAHINKNGNINSYDLLLISHLDFYIFVLMFDKSA